MSKVDGALEFLLEVAYALSASDMTVVLADDTSKISSQRPWFNAFNKWCEIMR